MDKIHELSTSLHKQSLSNLQLNISWISRHNGVARNDKVDEEAKAAAQGTSSPWNKLPPLLQSGPLPLSSTAAKQHYRLKLMTEWRQCWAKLPQHQHASKIDPKLPETSFLKLTKDISKAQASILFQLHSKHVLLCRYLYRIGKADSPLCMLCRHGEETVHHYLLDCPAHKHARFTLRWKLGWLSKSLHHVLGSRKALQLLLHYVNETGRFREHSEPQ